MTTQSVTGGRAVPPYANFSSLVVAWRKDQEEILLGFIWQGYEQMQTDNPAVNDQDLERSITQLLEPRIHQAMTGYEPFYIQHGPYERETMKPPPAQPPEYDLAFVLRSDERIMWPMEAKVLETPRKVSEYEKDVREQFLTCRYAPFSDGGAMLGYLLSGDAKNAFTNIAAKLGSKLEDHPSFTTHPHKISQHNRIVPTGKTYPSTFCCHHLILRWSGLKRSSPKINSN